MRKSDFGFVIVGETFFEHGPSASSFVTEGDVLELVPDDNNEYDSDAVIVKHFGVPIGYIANRGLFCGDCLNSLKSTDLSCPECGSELFKKGGLASKLKLAGLPNLKYLCFVDEIDEKKKIKCKVNISE